MPSGRPKGTNNRYWSKEEKLKIVKDMLENNLGEKVAGKKYGITHSLVGTWRRKYIEYGEEGLENKKKPIVYDYVDTDIPYCVKAYTDRKRALVRRF